MVQDRKVRPSLAAWIVNDLHHYFDGFHVPSNGKFDAFADDGLDLFTGDGLKNCKFKVILQANFGLCVASARAARVAW